MTSVPVCVVGTIACKALLLEQKCVDALTATVLEKHKKDDFFEILSPAIADKSLKTSP